MCPAQMKKARQSVAPPAAAASKLVASAQVMNFGPGTYSVDLAPQPVLIGQDGLAAPCVRLDTLRHNGPAPASAFISPLSDSDFILPGGPSAFVRVAGEGLAPVLMTVYRLENTASPEIRVRLLGQDAPLPIEPAGKPTIPESVGLAAGAALLVHVEGIGDTSVRMGEWAGENGSGLALEGFAIRPGTLLSPEEVEYQGTLGLEWDTPWFTSDEFCGSRGMALPLIGVRIRTLGEAAQQTVCRVWASFVGKGERGPFVQGALCACDGAAIEALRVEFGPPDVSPKAVSGRRRSLLGQR